MTSKPPRPTVQRIKTGSFERRLSLTKAGLFAGTRMATHMATNFFGSKEKRQERHREMMSRQARALVEELGRLKGSVVKIGQMMALYGEHFLPVEVTEALHTLEDQTTALAWPAIRQVLAAELGEARLAELDIETDPIGAASLGQVHRARRRSDGLVLCLKVQYPGVSAAVDADINAVAQMLKMARLVSLGPDFDEWLSEVRVMMHREVDYRLEARTTARFRDMLADDPRFIVPHLLDDYCTAHVLATSFEAGYPINAPQVQALSLSRRSQLSKAALTLFLKELFVWGEIQTDPNFGNYRIRLADESYPEDRIVLLDFGAVQAYDTAFLQPVRNMIRASYEQDLAGVIAGGIALHFMHSDWPPDILKRFGEVCIAVLEPLAREWGQLPASALNERGEYCWRQSDLPSRVAKAATRAAISRYFRIPPKEFVFLNRKLIGVYTFISVLGGEFNGQSILEAYLYP